MKKLSHFKIESIFKTIWWLILLIASGVYLAKSHERIIILTSIFDYIIILVFIVLVLLPLMSEIQFLGISVKKEINILKKELKDDVRDIKLQLLDIKVTSSSNASVNFTNTGYYLPPKDEVEKDIAKISAEEGQQIDDITFEAISEEEVNFFKIRLLFEKKLNNINEIVGLQSKFPIIKSLKMLSEYNLISKETYNNIQQVIHICNRGIHGEIIDNTYIDFVNKMTPKLISSLDSAIEYAKQSNLRYCDNCGFKGMLNDSKCPNCGFITDKC